MKLGFSSNEADRGSTSYAAGRHHSRCSGCSPLLWSHQPWCDADPRFNWLLGYGMQSRTHKVWKAVGCCIYVDAR
jgi:hypothetical protein